MKAHDFISAADEFTTNEHGRHGGVAANAEEGLLNFFASGKLIELVDSRVNSEITQECLDRMAHTASVLAEHNHWPVWNQLVDSLH